MRLKAVGCRRDGYTLVELITVLVILSVMAAIVVPSLVGFIGKAKEERYVMEAQEVRRSLEMYLIDHYDTEIDAMVLLEQLTSESLGAPDHPLTGYLTVTCSPGAVIEGMTLDMETREVVGFVYRAADRRIEIDGGSVTVTRMKHRQGQGGF